MDSDIRGMRKTEDALKVGFGVTVSVAAKQCEAQENGKGRKKNASNDSDPP
jgi:hypothetical protein